MKINTLLVLSLVALLTNGCSSKNEEHPFVVAGDFHRIESEFVEIDIRDPKVLKFDEIPSMVDSMFFIKLPDKPLLGNIDKVILTDSLIYLLDAHQTEQVLIYDKHENTFTKVSSKGRGPNEYIGLRDIAINKKRQELVLNDGKSAQKLVFDLSGKFIRKEPILPSLYFVCVDGIYLNQVAYGQSFRDDVNFHLVTSNQDSVIRKAFPYYPVQENDFVSKSLSRNSRDELLFMPSCCDTVYCIDSDSTYRAQYVLRQKKSLWRLANEKLSFDEMVRKIKEEGYTKVENFLEGHDYIALNVVKARSSGDGMLSSRLIYDKRSGIAYEYPDSNNTPATPDVAKSDVAFDYNTAHSPIIIWGDFYVSVFDPLFLKGVWENAVANGRTVEFRDPKFEDMIKNAKNESNLALVFFRFK